MIEEAKKPLHSSRLLEAEPDFQGTCFALAASVAPWSTTALRKSELIALALLHIPA